MADLGKGAAGSTVDETIGARRAAPKEIIYETGNRSLVLTGFMATGKTAVGRALAGRLGRPFVDMDARIEDRAGKTIPRIFAEDGEGAFRRMEAELCRELSRQEGLVIATGGGALVDPENRARMQAGGVVVCLTGTVEEILLRAEASGEGRPLLDVADPRGEVERLLAQRRPVYRAIPWQIDTSGLTIEEVTARVLALAGVVTLPVRHPSGQYSVHVGSGLLEHLGGALVAAGLPEGGRVAVVSNPVVAPLYGAPAAAALEKAGLRPFSCSVPDGEEHKTLITVASLYGQFLAGGLDRSGTVLALGGGVTGDEAGFAAATFMRGVRFAQVPTTLLAMVDASVGGKTGVDLPQGKNLAGAFKQPAVVLIDPAVLKTLPAEEMRNGLAEVIKHGLIGDPGLFATLEAQAGNLALWWEEGAHWIARSLQVKVEIVEEDTFEGGRRAVLNLGHTLGHALERQSGYALRHGEAVSIGMVFAARLAVELGLAQAALLERLEAVLTGWGLPTRLPTLPREAVWATMAHDKKKQGRGLRWVLPRAVGKVEVVEEVPGELVIDCLSLGSAQGQQMTTS